MFLCCHKTLTVHFFKQCRILRSHEYFSHRPLKIFIDCRFQKIYFDLLVTNFKYFSRLHFILRSFPFLMTIFSIHNAKMKNSLLPIYSEMYSMNFISIYNYSFCWYLYATRDIFMLKMTLHSYIYSVYPEIFRLNICLFDKFS